MNAITLNAKETNLLEQAQYDGLVRGMTALSTLTFRWQDLALQTLQLGTSAGGEVYGFVAESPADTVTGRISGKSRDVAGDAIAYLLSKVWKRVEAKVAQNQTLQDVCRLLKIGLDSLLLVLKKVLVSKEVLGQLIPLYNVVQGSWEGIQRAVEAHGHRTAFESLKDAAPLVGSGFPTVALSGFRTYTMTETIRAGVKSAYTFAKTIGSLLAQIFSAGVSSVLSFVAALVEAITSWAYSVIQAVTFDKATKACGTAMESREGLSVEEFRRIIKGCPYFGCFVFGAANYIGHFNLTALLSNPDNSISSSQLSASVATIGEVQKTACTYIAASHFEVGFRDKASEAQYGWILKMMQGYASDAPKSEFLTSDATKWQRFKHKAKKFKRKHF
jgi:hypothetical protein